MGMGVFRSANITTLLFLVIEDNGNDNDDNDNNWNQNAKNDADCTGIT